VESEAVRQQSWCDKNGTPFVIHWVTVGDFEQVWSLYGVFQPRPASQGLPPADDDVCRAWVRNLLTQGENVIARRGETVIGHATITPDPAHNDCEFVIFVHQDDRSIGVGSALTQWILDHVHASTMSTIWLTVDTRNVRAIRLYRKFRFEYCDRDPCERVMKKSLTD